MSQEANPLHATKGPATTAHEAATDPHGQGESSHTLKSRMARGSAWALVGYASSQALRLVSNLILWRLLNAEVFGIMAIINVLMQGLGMFSDVGIGPAVVQHERGDDPIYLNTAWTIQIIRGFCLFLVGCILAAPVAAFYKQPQLAALIPVVAFGAAISGFNSTRLFTLARKVALGRLTALDMGTQIVGLVVMLVGAWSNRSIWAIVIGGLASNLARVILSHTYLPGIRNHLRWDSTCVRTLLRFGRWVFFSSLLSFMVMQSDRLIFGKLIPLSLLGVYSIALTWATLPAAVFEHVFRSVLFPLLSRLRQQGTDFSSELLKARTPWLLLGGWSTACLMSGGPTLIRLLYDARATSAGWIIQVLAAAAWLMLLESANATSLLALGEPMRLAADNAAKLVGMIVFIPLGYARLGFPGAVAGFAASDLLRYATSVYGARRHKVACLGQDVWMSVLVIATTGMGMLAARWITPSLRAIAWHPARLGVVLEGLVITLFVSIGWGWVYLRERSRRHTQLG